MRDAPQAEGAAAARIGAEGDAESQVAHTAGLEARLETLQVRTRNHDTAR